jgi:hypothetical protein
LPTQLSKAEIKDLLSGGRTRMYKPTIMKFAESDEIYLDFMSDPAFSEKKPEAVYQSVTNHLKTLKLENPDWPRLQAVKKDGLVLLVNLDKLAGAESDEDSEDTDEDVETDDEDA